MQIESSKVRIKDEMEKQHANLKREHAVFDEK